MTKNKWVIIALISVFIPFCITLSYIVTANLPFWYDPARDFIYALDNLQKLTLIGPTTGIPGLFYGPYWIWLISFGLLFSKDPRIVIFITLTLPYLILFPYILFKFQKIFGWLSVIIMWILFFFGYGQFYATQPWNPNLAPLLLLILIYIFIFTDFNQKEHFFKKIFIAGTINGLLINFHLSFGPTVFGGSILFLIIYPTISKQKKLITNLFFSMGVFLLGVFITFSPFFLFELRHGFTQTKVIFQMLTTKYAIVSVTGLTKIQILQQFIVKLSNLYHLSFGYSLVLLIISVTIFVFHTITNKKLLNKKDIKILLLIVCYFTSITFIYMTAKNPVWSYHFVGIEILFLFLIGLFINKSFFLRIIFILLFIWAITTNIYGVISGIAVPRLQNTSLYTKEYIVNKVIQDNHDNNYTVYTYSPSIYTYEYSYLFQWLGHKEASFDPGQIHPGTGSIYLIIPMTNKAVYDDFINNHTPNDKYKTAMLWKIPDGTAIIKRVRN